MFMLWSAVNRISRIGRRDRRRTSASRRSRDSRRRRSGPPSSTARQAEKGSLEPGKLADLVILDRNPLTVEPMAIKDIKVVETIKEGRTIYPAQ